MSSQPVLTSSVIVSPSISLRAGGRTVIGRHMADIASPFQHPLVAPKHAEILLLSDHAELTDLGAGTSINGRRIVHRTVKIKPGDEIVMGPWMLQFTGDRLIPGTSFNRVDLTAESVSAAVGRGAKKKTLLDDVSLSFRPGEFVCIIGASGSGKSTLMNILSGVRAPTKGVVGMNRINLHENFEDVCRNIALVPQQTILHSQLTPREALEYTARLRLPTSVAAADRSDRVNQVLKLVRLPEHALNLPISRLSGGQQKRVCLANELISDPGLLLLDEVTSGLDEKSDGEMMQLFAELATQGKTLVCITHSLKHVAKYCHLVCVLAPGGRVAFLGPPADALEYFGISELGEIYHALESSPDRFGGEAFRATRFHIRYVTQRVASSATPRQRTYQSKYSNLASEIATTCRQCGLVVSRQFHCLRRDPAAAAGLFVQTLLVALMLILAFGQFDRSAGPVEEMPGIYDRETVTRASSIVNFVFLLAVTSFWFGCNNASRDIVRERAITNQERRFNLRFVSYLAAKLLLHCTISAVQVVVLLYLCWHLCTPPGDWQSLLLPLISLSITGTTLGLLISALAPSEQVAVTLIPVTIIPQIVLSGAIFHLTSTGKTVAQTLVTTWWGKRAADAAIESEWRRVALKHDMLTDASSSLAVSAILFHAALFAAGTLAALIVFRGQRNVPLRRIFLRFSSLKAIIAAGVMMTVMLAGCSPSGSGESSLSVDIGDRAAAGWEKRQLSRAGLAMCASALGGPALALLAGPNVFPADLQVTSCKQLKSCTISLRACTNDHLRSFRGIYPRLTGSGKFESYFGTIP